MSSAPADVRDLAERLGALRVGPETLAAGAEDGPLAGESAVVKDLFAVAGQRTGAGNPDWLAEAQPAERHATAVQRWVDAGVDIVGLAHTDELAFSLSGTNVHYGTPLNPAAPDRIPGGSSSGSVSAVAGGLVPFALSTDTGGSTRVPASYCGVFGIRTSHGRVPVDGLVPLVPRFDAVGVMASSGATLERATRALLGVDPGQQGPLPTGIVLASDVLELADPDGRPPVRAAAAELAASLGVELREVTFAGARLDSWRGAFMARQLPEIWRTHGAWVERGRPGFGPGIAARMADARGSDPDRMPLADLAGREVLDRVEEVLRPGEVLAFASASGPAPRLDLDAAAKGELRGRTIAMTCIAGLGGLPAVSLPLADVGGLPLGLCVLGRPGEDELVLAAARAADVLR